MNGRKARILVVDDESFTLELLRIQLQDAGYLVSTADNGKVALDKIHRSPPDLVISDILMPVMDGFGLCRQLRAEPELRALPIIFYSSHFLDPEDQKLAFRLGVSHYLISPQDFPHLLDTVDAVLNHSEDHPDTDSLVQALVQEIPEIHQARTLSQLVQKLNDLELSQQNLVTTEARYKIVLEAAPDAIVISNDQGVISLINRQAELLFGYSREELVGQAVEILIPEAQRGEHVGHRQQFLSSDRRFIQKHRQDRFKARNKAGDIFPVEINIGALISDGRKIVTAIIRDMREHYQAETQIRHLNRIYRVLSSANHALIHAVDERNLLLDYCRIIVDSGQYPLAWVSLLSGDEPQMLELGQCYVAGLGVRSASELPRETLQGLNSPQIPVEYAQLAIDALVPSCRWWGDFVSQHGCNNILLFSLRAGAKNLGVLGIVISAMDRFESQEVGLFLELAMDLGYGIETQRNLCVQRESEVQLRLQHRALESSSNGIVIIDWRQPNHPIVYANKAYTAMTGYALEEVIGRNLVFLCNGENNQHGLRLLNQALANESGVTVVIKNYHKDGASFWNEIHVAPVRDESGRVSHYVGVSQDVSSRISYESKLEHLATHDDLTGLANRALLLNRLNHAVETARRSWKQVAVVFLDLDRFKYINDSLGHERGDNLLKQVAQRLSGIVRSVDTLARMGGDEFVFVLTELEDLAPVQRLLQQILNAIRQPIDIDGNTVITTASVGCSLYPADGGSSSELLRHADAAMYRAKEYGGDGHQFYESSINTEVADRLQMEVDLRRALEQKELVLYYQPQVSILSGEVVGAEALVRWQHPDKGLLPPDCFIPMAEEIGVIQALGSWVLREACTQYRRWNADLWPGFTIAVNISYQQFINGAMVEEIEGLLAEFSIPADRLELELTERVMMKNTETVIVQLDALKAIGVKLSIDDFGTGFSSLSYLKRFSLDRLKIDRSFVVDLNNDDDSFVITKAINEMAHLMNFEVVAEGVENIAQLETLKGFGCDFMQGFLFSTPKPAEEFHRFMELKGTENWTKKSPQEEGQKDDED
ncbi:MAG: EAL domain-containing protein [Motiliproteus sp.]